MAFEGFSEQTIDFLYGIFFQNERLWFAAHKDEYLTHLQRPMKALADETFQRLTALYPRKDLVCRVARIYRDARRLHGRGPYKDHLWLTIRPENDIWSQQPVFWFEITPEEWSYGVGFWNADAQTLAAMRRDMDQDPKRAEKLVRRLNKDGRFAVQGKDYARKKASPPPCWRNGTTKRTSPWAGTVRRTRRCFPPNWWTPWSMDTTSWNPTINTSRASARLGWRI